MPENPSAFPLKRDPEQKQIGAATLSADGFVGIKYEDRDQLGMTLRDYFAAKALPSAIAHEVSLRSEQIRPGGFRYEAVAQAAYLMADAMLVERERSK